MKTLTNNELLDHLEDMNWCYRHIWSEIHQRAEREAFPLTEAWRRVRGYDVVALTQPTSHPMSRNAKNVEIDLILSELEL